MILLHIFTEILRVVLLFMSINGICYQFNFKFLLRETIYKADNEANPLHAIV